MWTRDGKFCRAKWGQQHRSQQCAVGCGRRSVPGVRDALLRDGKHLPQKGPKGGGGCWGAGNSQAGQAPSSGCLPCPRSGRAPSGRWVGPVGDLEKMCMMANVNRLANAVDTPPLTPEGMGSHRSCTPCCESAGREGEKIACCKKTHKKGEKMKISFYASAYVLCLKLGFGVAFQEFFASPVLSTINGGVLHLVVLICGDRWVNATFWNRKIWGESDHPTQNNHHKQVHCPWRTPVRPGSPRRAIPLVATALAEVQAGGRGVGQDVPPDGLRGAGKPERGNPPAHPHSERRWSGGGPFSVSHPAITEGGGAT